MKVNVGGERLGSGAKMNVELHNYYRSNHNLSKKFQSSLAPGVLYPAYVNVGVNGDTFDIDMESITRTLPTQGPLFGAFKMQVDTFVCPIRLYHGVLHNNPINIGLKANQIKLPKFTLKSHAKKDGKVNKQQINKSNLWKYLGMSGLGRRNVATSVTDADVLRKLNGVPLLAYYDIFKNYYANKQEDNAYVIVSGETTEQRVVTATISNIYYKQTAAEDWTLWDNTTQVVINTNGYLRFEGTNLLSVDRKLKVSVNVGGMVVNFQNHTDTSRFDFIVDNSSNNNDATIEIITGTWTLLEGEIFTGNTETISVITGEGSIRLQEFPLENFDTMREMLLGIKLGEEFNIAEEAVAANIPLPYMINSDQDPNYNLEQPMAGLMVKTYQSDIFNNWIKTETISGENGIAEITRVDTSNGLQMDALNLAQKVYNMLNRIAVSGGTYEDYQEAVWTSSSVRKAETPIYMGGMANEVMFEEVVSTAATQEQPLGDLGGRGRELKQKGGHVKIKVEEPSIIMVIVSLTPRISYSQGNKWFLTELDSIDDLHKPALDGIGYQDLLVEKMVWTGTTLDENGNVTERLSAGKSVAYIDWMTDINECYGDFADEEGRAYMVLNRNYNMDTDEAEQYLSAPNDITTYIDPAKYNYAFAYNDLTAQNFWTEIQFDVMARRLMSAKQIPNL